MSTKLLKDLVKGDRICLIDSQGCRRGTATVDHVEIRYNRYGPHYTVVGTYPHWHPEMSGYDNSWVELYEGPDARPGR